MQGERKSRPCARGAALLGLAVPAAIVHLSPSTVFVGGSRGLQGNHPEETTGKAATPISAPAEYAASRALPAPTPVAVAAFALGAAAVASLAVRRRSTASGRSRPSPVALAAVKEKVSAKAVKELRERSRAGMLDCKKALEEHDGDMEKAMDWLRTKGIAKADKKAGNVTVEGTVASYVHFNSKIATMVEVNSETDFVAANAIFQEFAKDVAMQIAANPTVMYVSTDDVPEDIRAKEKGSLKADDLEGKPEDIKQKIIEGRLTKKLEESALLSQKWLKDESKSVQQALKEVIAKLGENVVIRRFTRLTLGEGLEKKDTDFAAGVEQELAKYRVEEPAQPAAEEAASEAEQQAESPEEQMQWVMQYMKEHAEEVPNLKRLCESGLLSKLTEEFEAKVPAPVEAPTPEAEKATAPPPEAKAAPPPEAKVEETIIITAAQVKELRERSGAGILDSKKALKESGGDLDKAMEWLKKKGMAKADKKVGNLSVEGAVASYVHFNSKFGVLVEVNSETDFVAMNEVFKEFANDVAMQIASNPEVTVVSMDDVPQEVQDKEKAIELAKEDLQGKPENVKEKMVEGRLRKRFADMTLLSQKWLRDEDLTVQDVLKQKIAKLGENIVIRRFERLTLGEGLEKKQDNFAEGVEKELAKYRA